MYHGLSKPLLISRAATAPLMQERRVFHFRLIINANGLNHARPSAAPSSYMVQLLYKLLLSHVWDLSHLFGRKPQILARHICSSNASLPLLYSSKSSLDLPHSYASNESRPRISSVHLQTRLSRVSY